MKSFRLLFFFLLIAAGFLSGCQAEKDKNGNRFSLGTTLKVLEEKGDYGYFIKALEVTGYRGLVDGGGLVTVFAPGDEAFKSYLQQEFGTTDLDLVDRKKLEVLIGCHMIQFAYTTDDFLNFAMDASADVSASGQGDCYKYKTYGREPIVQYTDPLSRRKVTLFSREKYMPVFSTRMFASRGIEDAEGDYRMLFPNVDWKGSSDRLYAGNAAVIEWGIPTDNGYLYIVDKVMEPASTAYKILQKPEMADYSQIKNIFDRIAVYNYDKDLTKTYSATKDSLYLLYHWQAPKATGEIPEIASEWAYHNENKMVFDRALRYSVNCFFPKNSALEAYLKDYFKEYGTLGADNYLDKIPKNALYHFLRAHVYGGGNIILPSELSKGLVGVNGEHYEVSLSDVKDVKYAANGIIYGMDKVFPPAVYHCLTEPLFRYPRFSFYAMAFNVKNLYQQTVDVNNRGFTLFIQSDEDLAKAGYYASEAAESFGDYSFRSGTGKNMSEGEVQTMILSQFVYGEVPDLSEAVDARYYIAKDASTYFFTRDNKMYDYLGNEILVKDRLPTMNGYVVQTENRIPLRTGSPFSAIVKKEEYSEFKALMNSCTPTVITMNDWNSSATTTVWNSSKLTDAIMFFPTNAAILKAKAEGKIPTDKAQLRQYVLSHFINLKKNKLNNFLLPGLGPDGITKDAAYSGSYLTMYEYMSATDAKSLTIAWDPADSGVVKITDMGGNVITSVDGMIELHNNCACYIIDECFDWNTMFGNN